MHKLLLLVVFYFAALPVHAKAPTSVDFSTGLQGELWVDVRCMAPQRETEGECQTPLPEYEVRLIDAGGRIVAQTRSDAAGRFAMAAPPGRYQVAVVVPMRFQRCPRHEVEVRAQRISLVRIVCDSGMR